MYTACRQVLVNISPIISARSAYATSNWQFPQDPKWMRTQFKEILIHNKTNRTIIINLQELSNHITANMYLSNVVGVASFMYFFLFLLFQCLIIIWKCVYSMQYERFKLLEIYYLPHVHLSIFSHMQIILCQLTSPPLSPSYFPS